MLLTQLKNRFQGPGLPSSSVNASLAFKMNGFRSSALSIALFFFVNSSLAFPELNLQTL